MDLYITEFDTFVSEKGITEYTYSGRCDGIKFIALHSESKENDKQWSNGAIRGDGFDVLLENYGDDLICAIWDWRNIYNELLEDITFGLESKANEVYESDCGTTIVLQTKEVA